MGKGDLPYRKIGQKAQGNSKGNLRPDRIDEDHQSSSTWWPCLLQRRRGLTPAIFGFQKPVYNRLGGSFLGFAVQPKQPHHGTRIMPRKVAAPDILQRRFGSFYNCVLIFSRRQEFQLTGEHCDFLGVNRGPQQLLLKIQIVWRGKIEKHLQQRDPHSSVSYTHLTLPTSDLV